MSQLSCPSCGGELAFKSRFSTFCVCPYCASMLLRQGINVELIGKMATLAPDMSPLQIGTTGRFDKRSFQIIGRQKISWEGGFWNEWFLDFNNGEDGWLADAQGHYSLSFQQKNSNIVPLFSELTLQKKVLFGKDEFVVDDIREITCQGSEGELPLKSLVGRKSTSVDLTGSDLKFANVDFHETEGRRLFLGQYLDFEQFNFNNLKQIEGWT